jgi:hypothetical protein
MFMQLKFISQVLGSSVINLALAILQFLVLLPHSPIAVNRRKIVKLQCA